MLVDHGDVVEDRELLDRLLGLERAAQAPACATEVRHPQQVVAEAADCALRGADESAEDVEERRLACSVRPDQPARPAREDDADVVERRDAGEADGQAADLDHGAFFSAAACSRTREATRL
jgi:hypothetical protein